MFGKSYMLDMYSCKAGVCDDLELHYRFLEELVERIGMTKMTPPYCVHAPAKFSENFKREEIYPDKEGVSGFIGLIESGITIHSCEPAHFITLDVYSCKEFDENIVLEISKKYFDFQDFESNVVKRGLKYKKGV